MAASHGRSSRNVPHGTMQIGQSLHGQGIAFRITKDLHQGGERFLDAQPMHQGHSSWHKARQMNNSQQWKALGADRQRSEAMLSIVEKILMQFPFVKSLLREREQLRSDINDLMLQREKINAELHEIRSSYLFAPPGHFYSPIPSIEGVRKHESRVFNQIPKDIPGVDLREPEQLALLQQFKQYCAQLPFKSEKSPGLRYHYDNPAYAYCDAISLFCMIRHLRPGKVVEIGSGYSSCVTLDTNDLFFNGSIATTFIEPFPELLLSLVKEEDRQSIEIIPSPLQDVRIEVFEQLSAGDILFIDSTHVSKVNSDVNRIFFEILPCLAPGVYIHFHDVFYPFEYPKEWIYEGRAWNESYLLRAFLQYNKSFRIVLMTSFLYHFHREVFQTDDGLALCLKNPGGSIWICKESS